ncbi:MAG TPA: META domain-containing protein, partial [Gemmatimonadales bacterium]|nr:META domain-containing protein [Gemmatimonadales bacterium]
MPRPVSAAFTATLLLAAACGERAPRPAAEAAPAAVPITLELAKNLTYGGVMDTSFTLTDGRYERTPTDSTPADRVLVQLMDRLYVIHDITGDGVDDGAFLLTANGGGSGVFTYLVGVSGRGGVPKSIYTAELGDRTMVRSLTATDSGVTVEYVVAAPDDPACCPTLNVRQVFPMRGDTLLDVTSEELGRISPADFAGEWRLAYLDWDEPAPDSIAVTALFEAGRVAGRGGCNQYTGPFTVKEASLDVATGPMVSTRMACAPPVMEVENRYLAALGGVFRWGWAQGMLALTYRTDGGVGTLL